MSESNYQLIVPTNQTVTGPKFRNEGDQVIVDYDYERDDGSVMWSQITFKDVLAFEYRQDVCCRETDIPDGSSEVQVFEQSPYLSDVVGRWQEAVGWEDYQQQKGGAGRFKHFIVYFDNAASINVVAATVSS